ncbi:hypothetical protein L559_1151 [Bordetella pertussis STO1-CHOC-0017]|nr:hypothetical protein L559_1151 [Bordetella pertussis STO1-CHOC-0017]
MNKRHAGASALMALALLAGCSDVNQLLGNEESVDYKSTRRGAGGLQRCQPVAGQ